MGENMKRLLAGTAAIVAAVLFLSCPAYGISAQKAVLMDGDTGRILYEKRADEKSLIASTTKIMTAIVAIENNSPDTPKKKKSNLGNIAMVAMFIGLCTAYISSYIGGFVSDTTNYLPLLTAGVAAAVMAVFTSLAKRFKWIENFDVALSMLIAMAAAVLVAYIF